MSIWPDELEDAMQEWDEKCEADERRAKRIDELVAAPDWDDVAAHCAHIDLAIVLEQTKKGAFDVAQACVVQLVNEWATWQADHEKS